jgi:small-conductance mechanosensitive channel
MRRVFGVWVVGVVLVVTVSTACAQSLGDVARQTRQKEKAKGTAKKKVLTNEDLPAPSDPSPGDLEPVPSANSSAAPSAEEWKAQILAQKNGIATLKAQIDKLNDSVRFVEANAYYNGVAYNEHQKKKQLQVEQLRSHLAEQQKELEAMQEGAKKAGMGSAVYDP